MRGIVYTVMAVVAIGLAVWHAVEPMYSGFPIFVLVGMQLRAIADDIVRWRRP